MSARLNTGSRSTVVFSWSPLDTDAGSYTATFSVSDGRLTATAAPITITVTAGNRPPVANAGGSYTGATGQPVTLDGSASSDPDAGMFSGDLPNDIQGAGLNTPDTQFYLRAERGWSSRTYTVKYRAQDAHSNVTLNTRLVVVPVSSLTGGYITKDPDAETRTPEQVTLDQNYPNPFNPMTVIRYSIPSDGRVRLAVYDMLARRVTTLVDEVQTAGAYLATFDGSMLPSGLYTYVLEANGSVLKKTMGLVK